VMADVRTLLQESASPTGIPPDVTAKVAGGPAEIGNFADAGLFRIEVAPALRQRQMAIAPVLLFP